MSKLCGAVNNAFCSVVVECLATIKALLSEFRILEAQIKLEAAVSSLNAYPTIAYHHASLRQLNTTEVPGHP